MLTCPATIFYEFFGGAEPRFEDVAGALLGVSPL